MGKSFGMGWYFGESRYSFRNPLFSHDGNHPHAPTLRGSLPPEGAVPPWGRPGGGTFVSVLAEEVFNQARQRPWLVVVQHVAGIVDHGGLHLGY